MENPAADKLVSVVIPCLGRTDLTRRCLHYLSKQSLGPDQFDVVLVENGGLPSLDPGDALPSNVRRLPLDSNYGTAGGFNRGIAATASKFVFLLNNDVELEPDCLEKLVTSLEADERCAFASGKLLSAVDRTRLDGAGDAILMGGGAYRLGNGDIDTGQFDTRSQKFAACAAAGLFRRSVIEEIGGFDETFFAYLDDLDACMRANLAGYFGVYIPDAVGYHIGSATFGAPLHPTIVQFLTRNQLLLLLKNYPVGVCLRLLPRIFVFQCLWLALAISKGLFLPCFRGHLGALRALPDVFHKRRSRKAATRISSAQFIDLLRVSEREIYRWHISRSPIARSSLLNAYFRLFPSP